MRLCRQLFIFALLFSITHLAMAQQATVSGVVTDAVTGETIPGVNVRVKGSTGYGTSTGMAGEYTITINNTENDILVFSYVGYNDMEVPVNSRTELSVKMQPSAESLEEVVVIGYGSVKKVNLTGSVSAIKSDVIESRPVTNVSSALAGLGAGVQVMQGSGKPGDDGGAIRIRGIGTLNSANRGPIAIVDGIQGTLDAVNPEDIESISVLKDAASASIYGSQAANGVILITTKKGKKGKARVSYSGLFSIARPSKIYEYVSDYSRHMELQNESKWNIGEKEIFDPTTIAAWKEAARNPGGMSEFGVPNSLAYPNTNWGKEIFETNVVQKHNLQVMGGGENSTYSMSFGYLDNPGIMQNTALKQYQMRINLESKISNFLRIGTQTFGSIQDKELGAEASLFNYLRQSTPGMTSYRDGKYGAPEAAEESANANNPLEILNKSGGNGQTSRFNTNWYAIVDIWDGLTAEGRFNYQMRTYEAKTYTNPTGRYSFRTGNIISPEPLPENLSVHQEFYKNWSYTAEALLRYQKTFAKNHDVGAFIAFQQYYYDYYKFEADKKGMLDPTITSMGSLTEMIKIGGTEDDKATRSLFGRVNYAFKNKYLFEANFRYDGSSFFAKDNRWGFFPSFSGAWRVSQEDFMQSLKPIISEMKIRASWGQLGNITSTAYAAQASYGKVNYSFGGKGVSGLRQSRIANPNLQWERTTSTDVGLEVGFLNNRLSMEVGYYHRLTDGILTTPPIHLTMGTVGAPYKNTAEISNKGIEISASWKSNIGKDFKYSVSGNFAYNNNKVKKYKGKLQEGWVTENGVEQWKTNYGSVSDNHAEYPILENHLIYEYYLRNLYKGDGSYHNGDGTVNKNGGPTDGMIRTEGDMQWVQAMKAAGYQFAPTNTVNQGNLWYGEFIFADINGDKIYGNSNDRVFTGKSSTPKINYGFSVSASWKGIDFSMIWAGAAGMNRYWLDGNNRASTKNGNAINLDVAENHYFYNHTDPTDPRNNLNGKYPRIKGDEKDAAMAASTWNLYNSAYLKLKNLQVGYTLPKQWTEKIYISNLRVFFSGENLFTITSFPGLDPEIGSVKYPTMKQYSFGINLSF